MIHGRKTLNHRSNLSKFSCYCVMKLQTSLISNAVLLEIIEEARDAELCRNIDESRRIFQPIWENCDEDPDFSHFPIELRAELLRLAGFFLTFSGKCQNRGEYHLRGKDLLTTAIDLFDSIDSPDKSAEAKVMLALAYWYSGEVDECEVILEGVQNEFAGNEFHPVYLQIRVNHLMTLHWKEKYTEAVEIIKHLVIPMEFCHDARLITMFHNQAGIIYRSMGQPDKALFHINEAIRKATSVNNLRFVGLNLNNLAMIYKTLGRFDAAHKCIDEATSLFQRLNDTGWIPHTLDTKALIYLDEDLPEKSLETIDKALALFEQGTDHARLIESLWTKCRCLFRLGRMDEGVTLYAHLREIAAVQIGEVATTKYAKAFSDEIYCRHGLSYTAEVAAFKKSVVSNALKASNNNPAEAWKLLGLKSHQTLSEILNNQFPEIYKELGIPKRSRRSDSKSKRPTSIVLPDRDISRITNLKAECSFAFDFLFEQFHTFYLSERMMNRFGVEGAAIVAVAPFSEPQPGMLVVYSAEGEFYVGSIQYEAVFGRLFYINHHDFPTPLNEMRLIGTPVGYCLLSDSNNDRIEFSRLELK